MGFVFDNFIVCNLPSQISTFSALFLGAACHQSLISGFLFFIFVDSFLSEIVSHIKYLVLGFEAYFVLMFQSLRGFGNMGQNTFTMT